MLALPWCSCRLYFRCNLRSLWTIDRRHAAGAVEGLNNKIRLVTRRSYGFRTYEAMEIALYHTLGRLPEPESTHRYC